MAFLTIPGTWTDLTLDPPHRRDLEHLRFIKQELREGGLETLLFTCDTPSLTLDWGNVDNELMAINFQRGARQEIEALRAMRPNSPVLVSGFFFS